MGCFHSGVVKKQCFQTSGISSFQLDLGKWDVSSNVAKFASDPKFLSVMKTREECEELQRDGK